MEISLLKNLVEELNGDLDSFVSMKSWSQNGSIASAYVAEALRKKTPINDPLIKYFYGITLPFPFNYQNATFESIKSEGFGIISNNKIRNRIQKLYSNDYTLISKSTDMFNQEFLLNMNVQQAEHLDVINGNYPADYIGLQNNFVFINTLRDNGRNHEYHAEYLSKIIVVVNDLIDAIEQELSDK